MNGPYFQSSLGTVNSNSGRASKTWNDGSLNLGRTTKMHHKRATVDAEVFNGPNEITSREEQEGRNGPVMCSRYAGFDPQYKKPYGEFIPMQQNDRPMFVYAENDKSKPFVVGMLHHTDEKIGEKNRKDILPTDYPLSPDDPKEYLREIYIHRTQDGFTRDGNGEIEASSHTKAFFKTWDDDHEDEPVDEETYDYEDLHLKDKGRPTVSEIDETYHGDARDIEIEELGDAEYDEKKTIFLPEKYSGPLKYMAVVRNKYKDEETDYLRFFLDAKELTVKWNRQDKQTKKSTNWQLKDDGSVVFRRQLDAYKTDEGEKYVQSEIEENGDITVQNRTTEEQNNYACLKQESMLWRRQLDSNEIDSGEKYTEGEVNEDGDLTVQNRVTEEENNYYRIRANDILVRRQLDSNEMGSGEKYTYAQIDEEGVFTAENHVGAIPATLKLEEERALITVGASSIEVTPDAINIKAPVINLN